MQLFSPKKDFLFNFTPYTPTSANAAHNVLMKLIGKSRILGMIGRD